MRYLGVAIIACACSFGCGKEKSAGDDTPPGQYDSIELVPAAAAVTVPLGGTATQPYQVFGIDGDERVDITADCFFSLDQSAFGIFATNTATIRAHGGKANVSAVCGPQGASGTLTVNVTGRVIVGTTPANAPDLFEAATLGSDVSRNPAIEYPLDKAVSPRNIPAIDTQWTAGNNDLFHERMASSFVTVDIYTTDLDATLSVADWESVTQTAAGEQLAISVEGLLQADPATKFASPQIALTISHDDIDQTAIYYWASSAGNIMSQVFGETTAPSLVKDGCTSCHSLSRTGTRIGYSRCVANDCGQLFTGFMKYDQDAKTWNEVVNANDKAIRGSYTTFSPVGYPYIDDTKSLSIVSMSGGTLALYDPDTGAPVASNLSDVASHGGATPRSALMADWSADGGKVVYTSSENQGYWIDLALGRIMQMTYTFDQGNHVFGEPTFLVKDPITLPSGTYDNFFFPSYSPDGNLVVFNGARAQWRSNPARAAGQRLMLAKADGSYVTDLTAMNGPGDTDITWSHWAPNITSDYYWIVFSTERDYGHKVTEANSAAPCKANGVTSCKQIWIGAIARNKLTGAVDPSAPPMWLPGQDTGTTNISPFWTRPAGLQ